MKKPFLLILLLAFLIRIIALNQSLWLDEATTAKVVQNYNYADIIAKFSPLDFHPPLYYLFMKAWTSFFGYSEIALRFPSVIFSLLTGWFIYLIGGIWAATFFLFNPLIVYYSQEARMYMQATFLLTVAMYYFIKMLLNKNSKLKIQNFIWFNLFLILSFYTFYGSIFLIVSILIYWLYKRRYQYFITSFLILNFSILILSPLLLLKQFANAQKSLHLVLNWRLVLGAVSLKNLILVPLKFSFGRISFYPKWLYWLISGGWSIFVWFFVIKSGLRNKLFLFLLVAPLAMGLIFSFYSPLLQYFRFLYLIPIMSILLSKTQPVRWILIVGFVILSLIYLLEPTFQREDWRSLARSLSLKKATYIILSSADALKYYDKSIQLNELRTIGSVEQRQIAVIPYTADIYGFDYKKILTDKNYYLVSKKVFRGLELEEWRQR